MDKLSEQKLELPVVKRLTDELGKSLSKTRTKHGLAGLTLLFACLASLSKRGLIPANLDERETGTAIRSIGKEVFALRDFYVDDCGIALAAGNLITNLKDQIGDEEFHLAVKNSIACLKFFLEGPDKGIIDATLSDSLWTGWVYQYLIHQSEKELKKTAGAQVHSPFYTKWFTPLWIADFLVEQAITRAGQTFIDPAAGAGHILVPALKRTVSLLTESGTRQEEALKLAIGKLIFALEIDPQLTAQANLSLYLAVRDIDDRIPLDAANLFTIVETIGETKTPAGIPESHPSVGGSLRLLPGTLAPSTCLWPAGQNLLLPLDHLPSKFGALAANPPYMSMRNMPKDLSEFLKQYYPLSKYDLYSAFVELSLNLLDEGAKASLICQQSLLSISRFKPLRKLLEERSKIETLVQLGSGSFPTRPGEKVNNAIVTFRRIADNGSDKESASLQYARILYPEEKKQAEISGIKSILDTRKDFTPVAESESKAFLAPWCPAFVLGLFDKYPPLQNSREGIIVVNGLFTCNNKMFVKKREQVPEDERHMYVPYDKGGGRKWFHTTPYLLHWEKGGDVIRDYRVSRGQSRSLPGEDYYFKDGITYSYIGTQGFKARLLSPECIFDIASSSVFTPEPLRMYMLGFMNSALLRFLMGVLNPTINFQIGDLRRIPYAHPDTATQFAVSKLAQEAVDLAREMENLDIESAQGEFSSWAKAKENVVQKEIDELIFALYKVPAKVQKQILQDPWVVRGQKDVFAIAQKSKRLEAAATARK